MCELVKPCKNFTANDRIPNTFGKFKAIGKDFVLSHIPLYLDLHRLPLCSWNTVVFKCGVFSRR